MELRTLKYFLAVAREEGINRAAEAVHVTQPTLSRQLLQLEDELGVKLFIRGAKKISLTNEGILFRRRAEEILSLVEKTQSELHEEEKCIEGKITIGTGEITTFQMLPELLKSFSEKHPLVTYDIITATADIIKEQMEKGLIDIGVLLEPIDIEKFDFIRFEKKERYVVLMKTDDPLAKKKSVCVNDLKNCPLIMPRRVNIKNELSSWFGDSVGELKIRFTSDLPKNAAIMVQSGLGYALTVEGAAYLFDKTQIISRPLRPELSANGVIAWKKFQPFNLASQKFIEAIKASAKTKG